MTRPDKPENEIGPRAVKPQHARLRYLSSRITFYLIALFLLFLLASSLVIYIKSHEKHLRVVIGPHIIECNNGQLLIVLRDDPLSNSTETKLSSPELDLHPPFEEEFDQILFGFAVQNNKVHHRNGTPIRSYKFLLRIDVFIALLYLFSVFYGYKHYNRRDRGGNSHGQLCW